MRPWAPRPAARSESRRNTGSGSISDADQLLDPLRPGAVTRDRHRAALGARLRHRLRVSAVVAAKRGAGAMQHQRHVAVRAAPGAPALAAAQMRRPPAPRDHHDRLAAALAELDERGARPRVERALAAVALAHVEDLHAGQRRPVRALGQLDPLEPEPALGPRRRRAHDEHRPCRLAPGAGRRRARRSGGPTPACRRSRAPRRRRSARARRPARTRRSAGRRRFAPRHGAGAATRRGAHPALSAECRTATRSPNRDWKRDTVWGVRPISGTSTIAPLPRARAPSVAAR